MNTLTSGLQRFTSRRFRFIQTVGPLPVQWDPMLIVAILWFVTFAIIISVALDLVQGREDRNKTKNRMKRSRPAWLIYVKNMNLNIPSTWKWARGDGEGGYLQAACGLQPSGLPPVLVTKFGTVWAVSSLTRQHHDSCTSQACPLHDNIRRQFWPLESPRAHLHVVGILRCMSFSVNQPSSLTSFYSVLASVSVVMALSTVFHSIFPTTVRFLTVLPVLFLPYWSFQLYTSMKVSVSLKIILCGLLGLKHQVTNCPFECPAAKKISAAWISTATFLRVHTAKKRHIWQDAY